MQSITAMIWIIRGYTLVNMKQQIKQIIIIFLSLILSPIVAAQDVIKSPIDDKSYRYLNLENGLRVLLISDSDADKAAASLDVNVGNGSDPDDWGGLAHFLEHMLFLGTKKYPKADEYQAFIKQNGGSNNAYTSFDHTNYYFSISPSSFEEALDRFSRFFIDPTFDEVYVDRERSVVHSEYQARRKDEGRRLWDAQKTWLNPNHPASRFSVGSLETLRDREGRTVRQALIEFYETHYSASIMTLAVLGNESLDQLEALVVEKFSDIPNNDAVPKRFTQDYLNPDLFPARLNTVPDKDIHGLSFVFPVPSTYAEYQSKPLSYISNLLGHEGQGSLHALLKSRGWIESLSAGPGYTDREHGIFNVRMGLTSEGLEHIDEIASALFSAVDLIKNKGIAESRFNEQSKLAEIAFRFAQERDPGRVVQSLSARMHRYEPQDLLRGPYMMSEFPADRISELLGYINPDNVSIQVTSQLVETDKTIPRYDVSYSLEKISAETRALWKADENLTDLKLPESNPFVPKRLDLLNAETLDRESIVPRQLDTDSDINLWYAYDNTYQVPRANFYVNFQSPVANDSPKSAVLSELYVRLVNDQLNEYVYPAYLAEVNYSLYRHGRGISLRISGFEDRQNELLSLILGAMKNLQSNEEKFSIIKASLQRELRNIEKESPANQTIHEVYRLIMTPYWTEQSRLEMLDEIDLGDLIKFSEQVFQKVKVVALAHGDVSESSALSQVSTIAGEFSNSEYIKAFPKPTIRQFDQNSEYLRSMNIDHTDSALVAYFQGGDNSRQERAKMRLLKSTLESSFYNQLRTINRVGYLVHSGVIAIDRWPGLYFSVQSPSHNPKEINELYDEFLAGFRIELNQLDDQEFEATKQGLIDKILRDAKNLDDSTARFWREIDLEEWQFDSRKQFATTVGSLTKDDIAAYYEKLTEGHAAVLRVQSPGTGISDEGALSSGKMIQSAENF